MSADISASAAIAYSQLASLTYSHIIVGNGSNVATSVSLSGDATLANTGALTLATVNSNVGSFTLASVTVDGKGRITAVSSGTPQVTSVTGTVNQITSTGGTTPVLALASPLTTPGAITAGGALAMGANKITGLANGTASTDAAAFGQIPGNGGWVSFTPTGGWSTNTTYSGHYLIFGNTAIIIYNITLSGAPSGTLTLNIPGAITVNTTAFSGSPATNTYVSGTGGGVNGGVTYAMQPLYPNAGAILMTYTSALTGAETPVDATHPVTWANGNSLIVRVEFPI